MAILIEAAKRLKEHLLMAMSLNRKTAIQSLRSGNIRDTLLNHFLLQAIFPNDLDTNKWRKECRTFLAKTLRSTALKDGKTLPITDYILCLWEDIAEPDDCRRTADDLLHEKDMLDKKYILATVDYPVLSSSYKMWLTKWYDFYNNPHAKERHSLPDSVF